MDTRFNIERCTFSEGETQLTVYANEQMYPSVRHIIEDSTLDENAKKEKELALLKFELLDMKAHVEDLSAAIDLAEQKPRFVASALLQTMPRLRSDLVLYTEYGENLLAESYSDQSPSENSLLSVMQLKTRRQHLPARLRLFNTLKQACLSRQSSLQIALQLMSASPGSAFKQIASIQESADGTARDTQLSSPFSESPWCLLNYASPVCSTEPETIDDLVTELKSSALIEEVESPDDEVSPTEQAIERRWLVIARTSA